jgi:hypothetical protein
MLSTAPLVFTCFLIDARAGPAAPTTVAPSYRIDLRSVIKGPLVFEPIGSREPRSGILIRSLCFLDDQRLAATVVTRAAGKPSLATRGQPNDSSEFRLNAALIQAASGKILATPYWGSNSRFAWIMAANDSGFVVEAGTEITLLSPELRPVKRITLPQPPSDQYGHDRYWNTHSSWSGRRVLLFAGPAWSRTPWLWLDTENLQILASWQDVVNGRIAVSDDQVVREPFSQHFGDPPSSLMIESPGAEWKPIPSTLNASAPQFVGPDLLYFHRYVVTNPPDQALAFVIHTDGSEVFRVGTTPKGRGPGQAAVSRTGKRFVILVLQTRGGHPALDIGGHTVLRGFQVYDAPFQAASYTLEVRRSTLRNPDPVALSPDGRRVAICSYPEPIVEVFDLPPIN